MTLIFASWQSIFHMCISGASEQPLWAESSPSSSGGWRQGKKQKKLNRHLSVLSDVKPCSHAEACSCAPKCTSVHSLNFFLIIHHLGPWEPPLQCSKLSSEVGGKQKGDLCRSTSTGFRGWWGHLDWKSWLYFMLANRNFRKGKDSKKKGKQRSWVPDILGVNCNNVTVIVKIPPVIIDRHGLTGTEI